MRFPRLRLKPEENDVLEMDYQQLDAAPRAANDADGHLLGRASPRRED